MCVRFLFETPPQFSLKPGIIISLYSPRGISRESAVLKSAVVSTAGFILYFLPIGETPFHTVEAGGKLIKMSINGKYNVKQRKMARRIWQLKTLNKSRRCKYLETEVKITALEAQLDK